MPAKPTPPKPAPTPKQQKSFGEMARLMHARVAQPVKKK